MGTDDGKLGVYDVGSACGGFNGNDWDRCREGYYEAFLKTCENSSYGCGDIKHKQLFSQKTALNNMNNATVHASGAKVEGPLCANNCTSVPSSPGECSKNPSDPSCLQQPQLTSSPAVVNCKKQPTDPSCPQQSGTYCYQLIVYCYHNLTTCFQLQSIRKAKEHKKIEHAY